MTLPDVAIEYPVLEPDFIANPHPIYARMRVENPVYKMPYVEMGDNPWMLTRYDDSIALHTDARFTKNYGKIDPEGFGSSPAAMINRHMLTLDPPDHTRLRGLVHMAFTPKVIAAMNARIQEIADSLLDQMAEKPDGDLIADFALPLPITVIAELLGVPSSDRDKFRSWSQTIVMDGAKGRNYEAVAAAAMEFILYFHDLFDRRRAEPQDDLVSGLLQAEAEGDKLEPQELISMVFLLLVAGHETTVNLIANGTLTLLRYPDQLKLLRADPSLIKSAVEEILRFEGPVSSSTMRWALEDVTIRGVTIPAGDLVVASLLGADRDPEVFPDPDRFDITRMPNRHIAFGHGIHYCLGAPLARMEGTIALQALFDRFPRLGFAVEPDSLEWNRTLLLRSLVSLPLVYGR